VDATPPAQGVEDAQDARDNTIAAVLKYYPSFGVFLPDLNPFTKRGSHYFYYNIVTTLVIASSVLHADAINRQHPGLKFQSSLLFPKK
jgi:hypothetical protein